MKLQPIVYTTRMAESVAWYSKVLDTEPGYSSEAWTSIPAGGATLGIHHVEERPANTYVELSLVTDGPLEEVVGRLESHGIEITEPIREQPFGRSLLLRDPDGAAVQVNEHG